MRVFPILRDARSERALPRGRCSVPWEWVAPHVEQAQANHCQSLERLAARGGLSPGELYCAVHGLSLRPIFRRTLTEDAAEAWLASWDGRAPSVLPLELVETFP